MSKCGLGISWDHQYRVYAVRLELKSSGELCLLSYISDTAGHQSFGERLKNVLAEMQPAEEDLVAMAGYLPECVVVERALPPLAGKELEEALSFEVNDVFPAAANSLRWTYRIMNRLPNNQLRVRMMAIRKEQLTALQNGMNYAGIKVDALWHPFMTIDGDLDKDEIYLPFVEPDCVLRPVWNGLRQVVMANSFVQAAKLTHLADIAGALRLETGEFPLSGAYPSAVLAAGCLLRNQNLNDFGHSLLDSSLRRMRFRRLRHNIIYLSLLCAMCFVALIAKAWYQERDLVIETDRMIQATQAELDMVSNRQQTVAKRQVILRKFSENMISDAEVLSFLYRLTSILPDNMHVTNFACVGNRISVTIIFTGERMILLDLLGTISNYKLAEDTKTTLNADNKTSTAQVVWIRTGDKK